MDKPCTIDLCDNPAHGRGYCNKHWLRWWRNGDPLRASKSRESVTSRGEPMRWVHEVALRHIGDECLTWPFNRSGSVYGQIKVDGKKIPASRYVCTLVNGAPPTPGHYACHSCGKGHEGCVAPGHLNWKTPKENQADRLQHGTHTRGERNANAKITDDEARMILALKGAVPQMELAARFRVARRTIGDIHARRKWVWLSEEADVNSAASKAGA
jgi:hypothetical protein